MALQDFLLKRVNLFFVWLWAQKTRAALPQSFGAETYIKTKCKAKQKHIFGKAPLHLSA